MYEYTTTDLEKMVGVFGITDDPKPEKKEEPVMVDPEPVKIPACAQSYSPLDVTKTGLDKVIDKAFDFISEAVQPEMVCSYVSAVGAAVMTYITLENGIKPCHELFMSQDYGAAGIFGLHTALYATVTAAASYLPVKNFIVKPALSIYDKLRK